MKDNTPVDDKQIMEGDLFLYARAWNEKDIKESEEILNQLHIPYQYINSYYPNSNCVKEYCLYINEEDAEIAQQSENLARQINHSNRMFAALPLLNLVGIILLVLVFCSLFGSCVHLESGV